MNSKTSFSHYHILVLISLCISESASEHEHSEHQDFLFPDSQEIFPNLDNDPSCSNNELFCESLESYPYRQLKNILRRSPGLDYFFGQDENPPEFNNRVGEAADEKFVCAARTRVIFPQAGRNSKNQFKFIVNQKDDDGFKQGVQVEECIGYV